MDFKQFNNENSKVNIRAKAKNSIEYKMENYIKNHENGRIPINKCFKSQPCLFLIRRRSISSTVPSGRTTSMPITKSRVVP